MITHLNGNRLKRAIIAGSEYVIREREKLNSINVFPVADGDTGTNMATTMKAIAEGVAACDDSSVDAVIRAAADSALTGARGNSGAILAQFFQGFSEGLSGQQKIDTASFTTGAVAAKDFAYDALADPREGTVLTVMRDWSESVKKHSGKKDFRELFRHALVDAKESLRNTPKQLEVLRQAGVVDSGAQGFVNMLEGILHFIDKGNLRHKVNFSYSSNFVEVSQKAVVAENQEAIEFQYCTEFLLETENKFDKKQLRKELVGMGNSLIIGGSSVKTKVHIHTNEPEAVFALAEKYGIVKGKKFDDMREQHHEAFGSDTLQGTIAIVTDSTCDLPKEFMDLHHIRFVPLKVLLGTEEFIDKVTITTDAFYKKMFASSVFPKTSQPSPADFKAVYEDVLKTSESIISLHVSGALSGTYQNADTVRKMFKGRNIAVIDSHNCAIGLGLVIQETQKAIDEGKPFAEVVKRAKEIVSHTRIFLSVETVESLIKGGRLSKSRGFIARLLGINPVLAVNAETGKVEQADKAIGNKTAMAKMTELALAVAKGKSHVRFSVAYVQKRENAEFCRDLVLKHYPQLASDIVMMDVSPVVGSHAGVGAVAVAVFAE
jgi:DegV family protein with EDD domain